MDSATISEAPTNLIYIFSVVVFAVAMLLESLIPRRSLQANLPWRWVNNFSLGAVSWYVSTVAGIWFVFWASQFSALFQVGLLHQVGGGPILAFLILLLFSQFLNYWVHYAYHNVSWLWPIHATHHSDVDIDISTSYRNHPLEPLVSLPLIAPLIILLGVPPETAVAYRLFSVMATVFSHSNIKVPARLEKILCYVLLTPDFHRIHHCSEHCYTNSNYGSLVPWFDYLFGTARSRPFDEQESMELGLEYLREPKDSRLDLLLATPARVPRQPPEI